LSIGALPPLHVSFIGATEQEGDQQ
jgi:hypothetical protein